MALYEETQQLQEEQNAKFPDLPGLGSSPPNTDFGTIKNTPNVSFGPIRYNPNVGSDVEPQEINTPKSYERRLGPFYDPTLRQENFLAEQQSDAGRMAYMLPRIATKVISEVAQLPGYLGGAIAWGAKGFNIEDVNLMVDNFWLKAVQGVEDSVKDRLPVYTADVVKNGNLLKNITSTSFWANEGADGIGFLVAFLAPGAALRWAKFGAKAAKLIKPGTSLARTMNAGRAVEELTPAGMKLAGNINDITSTIVNTLFESAAEGGDTFQTILNETGDRQKAAEAAVDVVQKNFGILGISNYIDQKWLFGKFGLVKDYGLATKGLSKGSKWNRVFSSELGESGKLLDEVARRTTWNQVGNVSKTVLSGSLKEGFWEEGTQFAVQKQAEKPDTDDEGFLNEIVDIAKTYADNLGDTDMQKSIFLGAVMGSVMAGVKTVRDMKGEDQLLGNFHSLVKENNLDRYTSMSDIYEIDPTTDRPKIVNGKYKIDESKAREQLQRNIVKYLEGKQLVEFANNGNVEAFEKLKDQRDFNYFLPFLQATGGLEAAIHHINNLAETDMKWMQEEGVPINIQDTKQELINKVKRFQKIYDKIDDTHDLNMNVKYNKEDKLLFNDFSSLIKHIKLGTEAGIKFSIDRLSKLRNELASYEVSDTSTVAISSSETNPTLKIVDDLNKSLSEQRSNLMKTDVDKISTTIKNIEGHIKSIELGRKRLGELYNTKNLQKEFNSYKTNIQEGAKTSGMGASDLKKYKNSRAANLNPSLEELYNKAVNYELVDENEIRHSGNIAINYRDKAGKLATLTAEVLDPVLGGRLAIRPIENEAFDKEEKLIKETIALGETAYLNDDNSLTYRGEDFQIEDVPLLTKAPKSPQKEPKVTPTKPKSDNLTDIPTPEDKFVNIRTDEEGYITKFEDNFKHVFRVSSGINNWLVSTGNQKYAQSNDNLARWYIFVNKYAHEKDTEGRYRYNLKSYSFRQVGLLDELDPIRQNLTFVTSADGDIRTYDQIEDKNNSFANDEIKLVVFERTGKLVQVSKNGDPTDTEDKTQIVFSSLPIAELKTTKGYERFSLNKERETFLKKPGATEEQFTIYINKELEKSRVEYSNLRETMKDTQIVFDINAINPGAKIKVNENKENVLVEQDLLAAAGLTKATSLSKRIRYEARKPGLDAYNTKVNHTYSGTEHGITNGFWYLGIDNRLELIKPKTLGETESVDNVIQLLQFIAKGSDKNNTIRGYINTILYSGVNNNTGSRSPYAFYFDYPRDAKNKIIGEFTSLVFGDTSISKKDLVEGTNLEPLQTFLAKKYWNFDNKQLNAAEFTEYIVDKAGKIKGKLWEMADGGYKGFLFSTQNDNKTKGTVYVKPRAGEGLATARDPQYANQSISLIKHVEKPVPKTSNKTNNIIGGKPFMPFGQGMPIKGNTPAARTVEVLGEPNTRPFVPFGQKAPKVEEPNGIGDQTEAKPIVEQVTKISAEPLTIEQVWEGLSEASRNAYLKATGTNLAQAQQNAYIQYESDESEGSGLGRMIATYEAYELENLETAKAWLKSKFPNISVEIIDGLIDEKLWGKITKDAQILLSSIAAVGTGYHEGFHTYSQLVLSEEQRTELYNEVRRRLDKPDLTNKKAEEILAEEFRVYMISPDTYSFGKDEIAKKSFFQKLLDIIFKIFNINKIEDSFDILKDGTFDIYQKELPSNFERVQDRTRVKGLSDKETVVFVNDMNARFFDVLFNPKMTYVDTHLFNLDTSMNDIYAVVFDSYSRLANKYSGYYQKVLDNFEGIQTEHERFLKQYNINIGNITAEIADEADSEDNELDKSTYAYKDNLEIDLVALIDNPVRMLIAGLPSVTQDSKLLADLTEYKTRSTARFNRIMRLLSENLTNLGIDFNSYSDKIRQLSEKYPELTTLLDRLKVDSTDISKSMLILRNQFVRVFAHDMSTPLMTNYKPNGVKNTFNAADQERTRLIRTKWLNNARISVGYPASFVIKNPRGNYILDTHKLQVNIQAANKLQDGSRERLDSYITLLKGLGIVITKNYEDIYDYKTVRNYIERLSQEISSKTTTVSKLEYTPENITSLKSNEIFVFGSNAEGIHGKGAALTAKQKFGAKQGQSEGLQGQSYAIVTKKNWRVAKSSTLDEIQTGINRMLTFATQNPTKKFLVTRIGTALAGYTESQIRDLFNNLKNSIPKNVILPKEFEVRGSKTTAEILITDLFNADVVENQKETNALVRYTKRFFLNDTDLSFFNQDGNREYPINLPSHTMDVIDILNKITYNSETGKLSYPESVKHLMPWNGSTGNLFNGSSYWLEHYKSSGKINIVDLKGIIDQINSKNSSRISNATFGDYKAVTFNALLNGIYVQLRSADRRRELGFMLTDSEGNPSPINYNISRKVFKDRMSGYLKDELVTSFALLLDPAWGGNLSHYSKNARQLRTFNFLYDTELNAEEPTPPIVLEEYSKGITPGDNRDTITKARELVDRYIRDYGDYIDRSFDRYIDRMNLLTEKSLKEDSVLTEKFTADGKSMGIYPRGIDQEVLVKMGIPVASADYPYLSREKLDKMILCANYTSFIGSQEQLKYIMGDMAMWDDTTDFHKRVNGATSPKNKLSDSVEERTQLDELFKRVDGRQRTDGVDIVVVNDVISSNPTLAKIFPEYDNVNGTDAQSYALLDEYRDIMIRHGVWPDEYEKTYQYEMQMFIHRLLRLKKDGKKHPFLDKISSGMFTDPTGIFYEHTQGMLAVYPMFKGKKIHTDELGTLTIQKPQGFGHISDIAGLNAPQFFKTSTAPLFPSAFTDDSKTLDVILTMMDKQQGILAFGSSMKGVIYGNQNLLDITGDVYRQGYFNQNLKYADFGLQLDISDEEKNRVSVSTQRTRLEFLDIFDSGKLVKSETLSNLKIEYDTLVNSIVSEEREALLTDLGLTYNESKQIYELNTKEDIKTFKDRLIKAFDFALLPYNIIDGIDFALNSAEQVFDMTVNKLKIEEVLTSLIRRNIISRKTKGDMLVQESSIPYDEDLKFYQKIGSIGNEEVLPMEIMIALPKDLIPVMNKIGGLDKLNEAIANHDTSKLGKDFFKILDIPMNRIPGQALSSLDIGRVKKFLPTYHGAKVILPPEITVKASSDFDVDKMTSYFYYYKVEDEKVIYADEGDLPSKKNRLNEIAVKALLDPSRFEELITPVASKDIKDLTAKYTKGMLKTDIEYESYKTLGKQDNKWENVPTWWYNMQKGSEFFRSKKGTAIAAVHNAANALSQQYPIRMKALAPIFFEGNMIGQEEYYSTGFLKDSDGYSTSKNFAEFLSAFVDVVKDPFIFDLTDSYTFNTIAFLNRYGKTTGVGLESIVAFMTQPAIREYLHVRRQNTPKFLTNDTRLNFEKQYAETVSRLKKRFAGTDTDIPYTYETTVTKALNNLLNIPYGDEFSDSRNEAKELIKSRISNYKYTEFSKNELKSKEVKESFRHQVQILDNFMMYQVLAQKLVSLNLILRPDARSSMGRHLSSIEAGMTIPQQKLFSSELFNTDDFRLAILGTKENPSLIKEFYSTQALTSNFFGNFFLAQKDPDIRDFFESTVLPHFANPDNWKKKQDIDHAITTVESELMTFIIADSLGKTTYKEMQDFYKDLFIGENSVPKELLALKNVIEGNVAINELEPDIAHRLTKSRTLSETDNISLFNKAFNIQELDVIESDLYSLGVEPSDTNKKFLYRLMLHSIFQSGFTNAANSYMKVIPNRIFIDVAEKAVAKFSAMTSEAKRAKLNSFYEQLFRNSVSNPDIVPRYPWTTRASRKTGYWFPKTYTDKRGYYSNYNYIAFNYYTHQPFSYWRSNKSAPTSVVLYKRVGANTFEFISKQGEGIRMREYYPMLNDGDIDNVTIVEASRYNKLPLDVVYAEEPIQNDEVSGKDINDEELPFGENIHKFDINKLSGRDFDFIGEDQNNSYYKVLGKESTMHRALRMIENKSTNPSRVQLAKVLKSALSTAVPLYIQKKNFEKELDPDTGRPASVGAYDYNGKKAYVYEKLDDIGFEVATLHEAMHALSHNEVEKNSEFKDRIQKIADHAYDYILKNYSNRDIIQMGYDIFTNPHEFITHGFTSSTFQSILAKIPAENPELVAEKAKEISVLKDFMNTLLSLIKKFFSLAFGSTRVDYNNALQGMESTLKELILVVDEGLREELKPEPIINVIGNQSSSNDEIKVINKDEQDKEDSTEFDKLYPQYSYLNNTERTAFQDAVNKGIIRIACGL